MQGRTKTKAQAMTRTIDNVKYEARVVLCFGEPEYIQVWIGNVKRGDFGLCGRYGVREFMVSGIISIDAMLMISIDRAKNNVNVKSFRR